MGMFFKKIIYKDFTNTLYNLRKQEDNIKIKKLYKLILNSMYGKYGAIYERKKTLEDKNQTEVIIRKHENVAISAAITAYGRVFMYNYIINNNLNLYYWDTDGSKIYSYFAAGLKELSLSKIKFNFYLDDFNYDTIEFNFTFHNKRKYFILNNIIDSQPWLIKYSTFRDED
jgi:hypothetical protein